MSIRTFNKFITGNGCIVILSILLAILFIVGFLSSGFKSLFTGAKGNGQQTQGVVIAQIGQMSITSDQVSKVYATNLQAAQDNGSIPPGAPAPQADLQLYGQALGNFIVPAINSIVIRKEGIQFQDSDILNQLTAQFMQQMHLARQQLIETGKLSPNASQNDFDALLKKGTGQTQEEMESNDITQAKSELKDSNKRQELIAQIGSSLIPEAITKKLRPTEAEVKASFSTLTVMRVLLTGTDANATAKKVEQLAHSGTSFDTLVDQYTKDIAPKGKRPSQVPISIAATQLQQAPYDQLATLKPGDISQPLSLPEGIAIYKIIKSEPNLPSDWAKNKANYTTQFARNLADTQYQNDVKGVLTQGITWKSPGWQAIWEAYQKTANPQSSAFNWADIASIASKAAKDSTHPDGIQAASLAYYIAASTQYNAASKEDQPKFEDDYLNAIQLYSNVSDTPDIELERADLLAKKKDSGGVANALSQAMNIISDFSQKGLTTVAEISQKEQEYQKAGIINAAMAKQIDDARTSWMKNYQMAIEQQKQAAAAQQKQMAEAAKEKAAYEAAQKKSQAGSNPSTQTPINRDQLNSGGAKSSGGNEGAGKPSAATPGAGAKTPAPSSP